MGCAALCTVRGSSKALSSLEVESGKVMIAAVSEKGVSLFVWMVGYFKQKRVISISA